MGQAALIPILAGAATSFSASKLLGADTSSALKMGLFGGATGGIGSVAGPAISAAMGGTAGAAGTAAGASLAGAAANPFLSMATGGAAPAAAAPSWNAMQGMPGMAPPVMNPIGQANQAAPGGFAHQTPGASSGGLGGWLGSLKPADFGKAINTLGPIAMYTQNRKDSAEARELARLVAMSEMQRNAYRPPPSPQLVNALPGQFGGGSNAGFKYGR